MATDFPSLNELLWRVGEAERRIRRIESGEVGTITGTYREDLTEIKDQLKSMKNEVLAELGNMSTRITAIEATENKRAGVRLTIGSIPVILSAIAALGSAITVAVALAGGFN